MLNANPSYIFFREVTSSANGPVGAIGQPLTEGRAAWRLIRAAFRSVRRFSCPPPQPNSTQALRRLMLAQDTGSAIKAACGAIFLGLRCRGWGAGRAHAPEGRDVGAVARDQVPR
jgi:membrane-bound lytic murein transglycosylase A